MKMNEYFGPYDALYAQMPGNLLWGHKPTHMTKWLDGIAAGARAIDLGCGDGVNALELERRGFFVRGIDMSGLALSGLRHRFDLAKQAPQGFYEQCDIEHWDMPSQKFDIVLSCGLLQCLNRKTRAKSHHRVRDLLLPGGLLLFSCLTDKVPLKAGHMTPGLSLVSDEEVDYVCSGLSIEYTREAILEDAHGSLVGTHEHSVKWVVARRLS